MESAKGKLFLALAFTLAGSSVVAAGRLSHSLGPFTIAFLSLAFATPTAFLLYGRRTLPSLSKLGRSQWVTLFMQAVFGIFLFRVFLAFGLLRTGAAEAGILTGTTPAITAVLAHCFLRERIGPRQLAGVLLTVSGVLLLQGFSFIVFISSASPLSAVPPGETPFSGTRLAGNLLVLCAAACESAFAVLSRKANSRTSGDRIHPLLQSGVVSGIALLLCLVLMMLEHPLGPIAALRPGAWAALMWYGCFATVAAFACMFAGAAHCDSYTIAAFSGLMPSSSLLLSILLLNESVGAHHWAGCALIAASLCVMGEKQPIRPPVM